MSTATLAQEIQERGYCALEGFYGPAECREMRERLDAAWLARGAPVRKGFGFNIHPLLPVIPELGRFLVHPAIMEIVADALGGEAKVVHAGARVSDENSDPAIGWHVHYSWDASLIPQRSRCERLLGGVYVDGSNAESGPLTVIPRRFDEPIGSAPLEGDAREVHVDAPPGTFVIFDTALWHRAKRGSQPGVRRLFGAHYQPVATPRAHPEDNDVGALSARRS